MNIEILRTGFRVLRPHLGPALATLALCGCGNGTADVCGTVKFNGTPLKAGTVTFFNPHQAGLNVVANIRPDGTYRAPHCPTGKVKVTVQPLRPVAKGLTRTAGRPPIPPVPARYADPDTTDLVAEVRGGSQTYDIDIVP